MKANRKTLPWRELTVLAALAVVSAVTMAQTMRAPVTTSFSGLVYNRATQTFNSVLTLTNNGPTLYAPLSIGISTGSASVTVSGATNGTSTIATLPNGSLLQNETITLAIAFVDPTRVTFTPTITQVTGASVPAGLGVHVITPTAGQTPAGPTFLVTGTLNTSGIAGASVDGVAACVVGSTFFVDAFTPQVSLTSFTAAANDIDGGQITTSVTISPSIKGLQVSPSPACGGIAPVTESVNVLLITTDGDTIVSETIDFGAGTGPASATPGAPAQHVYTNPGLYTVTVKASTVQGANLIQSALVSVLTQAQAFSPMQSTASLLKTALQNGDAVRAASLFSAPSRANYLTAFTALAAQMPTAGGYLSSLSPVTIGPALTQASFPATVKGVAGFLTIEFAPDATGIWRVESW